MRMLHRSRRLFLPFLLILLTAAGLNSAADYSVASPDGNIAVTVTVDEENGTLFYRIESRGSEIVSASPVGIHTSRGDFRTGLTFVSQSVNEINETYILPHGKVSTYKNHANEQTLRLSKNGQSIEILFRAYNDGVAFCFVIPGSGEIEFFEETSAIHLAGRDVTYWGQQHPNRYGYEGSLGPVTADRLSVPVLACLKDSGHYVLMGQAATYGHYIQPHFERSGSAFRYCFPLDQSRIGPVRSTLPFQSPWRMIIISPSTPARIVESYLVENLNPSTDSRLLNPDGTVRQWVRSGRAMWDYIAGDRDNPIMWVDLVAAMGWEYYLADAGFADRWGGEQAVRKAIRYAASKNVGIIGWAHTRDYDTYEKAAAAMRRYARWGLKGAKIDFFDHNTHDENPTQWRDYEDTQRSLQMRDWIFELGIENRFVLELHGNTMPSGERRRYPHLMTLEGVDGMERKTKPAANDLTIPYMRNVMGPVSYTVIHFDRSPGSDAYQLAMPIVYEAGIMIYAEHGQKLLAWTGKEMIQKIPSAWDETRFIEGKPAEYILLARRKGQDWFVAGMTDQARTAVFELDFLDENCSYAALIFRDQTQDAMDREIRTVTRASMLSIPMLQRGGFAMHLSPVAPVAP